jgi:hypothetical protein
MSLASNEQLIGNETDAGDNVALEPPVFENRSLYGRDKIELSDHISEMRRITGDPDYHGFLVYRNEIDFQI